MFFPLRTNLVNFIMYCNFYGGINGGTRFGTILNINVFLSHQ